MKSGGDICCKVVRCEIKNQNLNPQADKTKDEKPTQQKGKQAARVQVGVGYNISLPVKNSFMDDASHGPSLTFSYNFHKFASLTASLEPGLITKRRGSEQALTKAMAGIQLKKSLIMSKSGIVMSVGISSAIGYQMKSTSFNTANPHVGGSTISSSSRLDHDVITRFTVGQEVSIPAGKRGLHVSIQTFVGPEYGFLEKKTSLIAGAGISIGY